MAGRKKCPFSITAREQRRILVVTIFHFTISNIKMWRKSKFSTLITLSSWIMRSASWGSEVKRNSRERDDPHTTNLHYVRGKIIFLHYCCWNEECRYRLTHRGSGQREWIYSSEIRIPNWSFDWGPPFWPCLFQNPLHSHAEPPSCILYSWASPYGKQDRAMELFSSLNIEKGSAMVQDAQVIYHLKQILPSFLLNIRRL